MRCIGLGPQVHIVRYDPEKPHHERYQVDSHFLDATEYRLLSDMALTINAFFGWDFNSCEALRKDGEFHLIDFANPCPDSQVTSPHYHFPWVVKANIRWTLFCAAARRPMHRCLDWDPFFRIAARDWSFERKLRAYARLARRRLDADRFEEFCGRHLQDLDQVALEFFASSRARDAIRAKVEAVFAEHEWDRFTDRFWGLVEFWCRTERDRFSGAE